MINSNWYEIGLTETLLTIKMLSHMRGLRALRARPGRVCLASGALIGCALLAFTRCPGRQIELETDADDTQSLLEHISRLEHRLEELSNLQNNNNNNRVGAPLRHERSILEHGDAAEGSSLAEAKHFEQNLPHDYSTQSKTKDSQRYAGTYFQGQAGKDSNGDESQRDESTWVTEESCNSFLRHQISHSEVVKGLPLNNEYEVVAFSHFTWSRVYPSSLGLGRRVVEKPIGYLRKDLLAALSQAMDHLNAKAKHKFTLDDFIEGSFRTIPTVGAQYELMFRESENDETRNEPPDSSKTKNNGRTDGVTENSGASKTTTSNHANSHNTTKNKKPTLRTVTLMRAFGPTTVIKTEANPVRQLVNIILPLSGRLGTFHRFVRQLVHVIYPADKRVFLTVVYFGTEGLQEAREVLTKASKETGFRMMKLLNLNETFSRGKALQVGASHWTASDVLLFMCDVDIAFTSRFLDRCRVNAQPGQSVYFPIVFSLYNPQIVYTMQGKVIPTEQDQLTISRDTGFWRDFGYGMSCQYRSDFLTITGAEETLTGWGGEDVLLYRKYVRSPLRTIRSTDPGIFHLHHAKTCPPHLSANQRRACLASRALTEASHAHLGLLVYRGPINASNDTGNITVVASDCIPNLESLDGLKFNSGNSGNSFSTMLGGVSYSNVTTPLASSDKYKNSSRPPENPYSNALYKN